MKNFSNGLKKYYLRYIIAAAISLVVAGGIFCLLFFTGGCNYVVAIDGLTVGGGAVLAVGGLVLITKLGFFDFAGYGFKQLGSSLFNRHQANKYNDFYEYKKGKNQIRETSPDYWFPILIIGALVLTAAIVFYVIWDITIVH